MKSRCALVLWFVLVALVASPASASAQASAPPAPGSLGAQMDSLAQWLAQHSAKGTCAQHCFVLTRMHLGGDAGGAMTFSIEGAVLADAPFAVPLFGPPAHARVENVTENGKPAALGFEGSDWFVMTPPGRFVVEGTLTLDGDMALAIPGPLDALDVDLSRGRVVEGAHLSGLAASTVHFDRDAKAGAAAAEPPVFQLSRAVRVAREVTFEYRLVMRSGQDLGVVKLPLAYGEQVLDVQGSSGWTQAGGELVLPTAGRAASIEITGKLPNVGKFEPDARSSYEWWLVESDAEHRVSVEGDARQVDASQSPIARTQPSAKLLLVGRGQHIEVGVQTLVAADVLAAVVRSHDRTLVLTPRGDLVADDVLTYENDGIDWLAWPPTGRAVFLATDGRAERVMQQADGAGEVLVPLRVGSHTTHLQSVSSASIGALGGWLSVPTPTHALTTSRATVTLGLPAGVHPIAVLGGDRPWFAYGWGDAAAIAASIGIAVAALRGRAKRVLASVSLVGLWVVSPAAWWLIVVGGGLAVASWMATRLLSMRARVAVGALAAVGGVVVAVAMAATSRAPMHTPVDPGFVAGDQTVMTQRTFNATAAPEPADRDEKKAKLDLPKAASGESYEGESGGSGANLLGQMNGRLALGGVAQGVTPVALTMPQYDHCVSATRELVTRDRPLSPVVVYVTSLLLAPLVALWLACIGLFVRMHRAEIAGALRAVRERLARREEPEPAPAAPPPLAA